jgi:hypothetical protein
MRDPQRGNSRACLPLGESGWRSSPGRAGGCVSRRAWSWSIPSRLCLSPAMVLQSGSDDTLHEHLTEQNVRTGPWSEDSSYDERCRARRFRYGMAQGLLCSLGRGLVSLLTGKATPAIPVEGGTSSRGLHPRRCGVCQYSREARSINFAL